MRKVAAMCCTNCTVLQMTIGVCVSLAIEPGARGIFCANIRIMIDLGTPVEDLPNTFGIPTVVYDSIRHMPTVAHGIVPRVGRMIFFKVGCGRGVGAPQARSLIKFRCTPSVAYVDDDVYVLYFR